MRITPPGQLFAGNARAEMFQTLSLACHQHWRHARHSRHITGHVILQESSPEMIGHRPWVTSLRNGRGEQRAAYTRVAGECTGSALLM